MRLPADETSFEFGVQSQNPGRISSLTGAELLNAEVLFAFYSEYLDVTAPETISEFGHLIRITALFSQMGDAVGQWPPFGFCVF